MSSLLLPMVPVYAAAVAAKNLAWDRGWRRPRQLAWPVVSIGNLSVGGSGKTPLAIRIAELLRARGIAIDVLSRGYGRRSSSVERVRPEGTAEQFGDEPLLIARSTGVRVYVGRSRHGAGMLAESQSSGAGVHLLDDGFQHRQLGRHVDIVVLHRRDFTAQLLPAGRLREGFSSLSRAHILVLREEDEDLREGLRRRGFMQPVWLMERRLEVPEVKSAVGFCAIARPEEFFSGLRSAGIRVAATLAWRDHHRFTASDIAALDELRRQHGAEAFLTTEKDMARISTEAHRALEVAAPLHAARLVVRLRDEAGVVDTLLAMLPSLPRGSGNTQKAP